MHWLHVRSCSSFSLSARWMRMHLCMCTYVPALGKVIVTKIVIVLCVLQLLQRRPFYFFRCVLLFRLCHIFLHWTRTRVRIHLYHFRHAHNILLTSLSLSLSLLFLDSSSLSMCACVTPGQRIRNEGKWAKCGDHNTPTQKQCHSNRYMTIKLICC